MLLEPILNAEPLLEDVAKELVVEFWPNKLRNSAGRTAQDVNKGETDRHENTSGGNRLAANRDGESTK
jgi:hypothetical protein